MGWKDFFRKKKDGIPDPVKELVLSNLKAGWLVDFDMKTWKVAACHYYDWGMGDLAYEWQLQSYNETVYLERETDDEDCWSISRKIPANSLESKIFEHIRKQKDPPDKIVFEKTVFFLEQMSGGHYYKDGKEPGRELLRWDYTDETGKKFFSLEQWGEDDFEAAIGMPVEEYQFTDILPC